MPWYIPVAESKKLESCTLVWLHTPSTTIGTLDCLACLMISLTQSWTCNSALRIIYLLIKSKAKWNKIKLFILWNSEVISQSLIKNRRKPVKLISESKYLRNDGNVYFKPFKDYLLKGDSSILLSWECWGGIKVNTMSQNIDSSPQIISLHHG